MNTDKLLSIKNILSKQGGSSACLVSTFVNQYYLANQLFKGFIYVPSEGDHLFFLLRETEIEGEKKFLIRKPEEIPDILKSTGYRMPEKVYLEAGQITHNDFARLAAVFKNAQPADATALLRQARMIKTPWEIEQFRISARKHEAAYSEIPSVFRKGMKDIDFQIEIERLMRQHGSLGIFRTFGDMDIFMGSLLTGNNAAAPSPYDFALGGAGLHPCLPIGASGETITEGKTVMVDFAGNFTAYMTDMTRVFACGKPDEKAIRAHNLSIEMHRRLREEVRTGVACSSVWEWSLQMAKEAKLDQFFMGTRFQAKFVGHGVGLEINEPPVLTARSRDTFAPGMVFAYEPKFVLPDIGAVGNENTYLVAEHGLEQITNSPEEIMLI
jgi:Xaa-Pro aminopeptidase